LQLATYATACNLNGVDEANRNRSIAVFSVIKTELIIFQELIVIAICSQFSAFNPNKTSVQNWGLGQLLSSIRVHIWVLCILV